MGYKMLFKKNESIEFANRIMKQNRIPILICDEQWKKIFSNNMNKYMESLSRELKQLLDEERQLEQKLRSNKERKRILMNKIIHLSNRVNSNGEEDLIPNIEEAKYEIDLLNQEIDQIYESLELYPERIASKNIELLRETARVGYSEINQMETRLLTIDKEIDKLRQILGDFWDEKELLENKTQALYSLLHSIIGPEAIEKLDLNYLNISKTDKK